MNLLHGWGLVTFGVPLCITTSCAPKFVLVNEGGLIDQIRPLAHLGGTMHTECPSTGGMNSIEVVEYSIDEFSYLERFQSLVLCYSDSEHVGWWEVSNAAYYHRRRPMSVLPPPYFFAGYRGRTVRQREHAESRLGDDTHPANGISRVAEEDVGLNHEAVNLTIAAETPTGDAIENADSALALWTVRLLRRDLMDHQHAAGQVTSGQWETVRAVMNIIVSEPRRYPYPEGDLCFGGTGFNLIRTNIGDAVFLRAGGCSPFPSSGRYQSNLEWLLWYPSGPIRAFESTLRAIRQDGLLVGE
jgi:hypothetical protein